MSVINELCVAFNAKRVAMLCAMWHGQVSIDGFVIRAKHEDRWTRAQLRGRMARMIDREARLFPNG